MRDLVMMALGAFRFGILGGDYQTFRRSASWRWDQVDRAGRAPAMQFAGPGAETISLSGVIYPAFAGGFRQVELMRAQAGLGVPMMLTDGMGFVWRRWCITSAEETRTLLFGDGAPRRLDFGVELVAYGEDRARAPTAPSRATWSTRSAGGTTAGRTWSRRSSTPILAWPRGPRFCLRA